MKSAHPPLEGNVRFYPQQNQQIRDKTSKSCRKYVIGLAFRFILIVVQIVVRGRTQNDLWLRRQLARIWTQLHRPGGLGKSPVRYVQHIGYG